MKTREAAKLAGFSYRVFLRKAKALKLTPNRTLKTGLRGRPAFLWNKSHVESIAR